MHKIQITGDPESVRFVIKAATLINYKFRKLSRKRWRKWNRQFCGMECIN